MKKNCWQFKRCGRELGGKNALAMGVCPASIDLTLYGVHHGVCAGRACWVVPDTVCEGQCQGTFDEKYTTCANCDFYLFVREEEGQHFQPTIGLLALVRS